MNAVSRLVDFLIGRDSTRYISESLSPLGVPACFDTDLTSYRQLFRNRARGFDWWILIVQPGLSCV